MLLPEFSAEDQGERAGWEKIADAKSDTYKPVSGDPESDDVSRWLIAMATYTDRRGSVKLANMSSANVVIVNNDNVAPMFEENNEEITETTRKVKEDAKPNEATGENDETTQGNVGDRVMATDPNPSDLLTYTLSGPDMALFKITNDTGADADADADAEDRGGQISLNANTELDYEARTTYMVTVTAADPDGEMASVDVTIKVTDVNEAPMISTGPSIVGPAMSYYDENDMVAVASYEGAALNSPSWSLSGDDAEDFGISSDGMLTFNNTPDYEMPEDAGGNNVYDVTVKATDGTNPVMKNVKVMVRNVDEMGTLVLSSTTPSVDAELTATLTDLDGMVSVETWMWYKSMDMTFMDRNETVIDNATSMSYTPVADDAGYYLMVKVMYTDGHGPRKEGMATTSNMVVAGDPVAGDPLLIRYDANNNDKIDIVEVLAAIDDYFNNLFNPASGGLTKEQVYKIIDLYFDALLGS